MSTLTFDPSVSPCKLVGNFAAPAALGPHDACSVTGAGWWAADVTGTSATIGVFPSDTHLIFVSVDGGSFTEYTGLTAFAYQALTLFTGLSDAAHTVVLKVNHLAAIQVDGTALSVTGSAPAVSTPTGYNYFRLYNGVAGRSSAGLALEGSVPPIPAYNQYALDPGAASTFGVRFRATTTTVRAAVVDVQATFALTVDGVTNPTLSAALANTGALDVVTLFSGLDGAAEHEYVLTQSNAGPSGFLEGIVVDALNGTALADRVAWAFYGDSLTQSLSGTSGNSTLGFPWLLSQANGKACQNKGLGGTYVSGGGPTTGAVRTADITAASPAPAKVITWYGVNDLSSSVDATTFGAAYNTMVSNLHSGLPSATLYFLSIPYHGDNTLRAAYNAAIQSAVTSAASANVVFVDAAPLLAAPYSFDPTSGVDTADGLHPNAAGYVKIQNFLQATVAPPVTLGPRGCLLGVG